MNEIIHSGRRENDVVTFEKTLEIMKVMDTVRSQIGARYPADDKLE